MKAEELTLGDIVEIKFGDRYVPYLFFQSPFFNIVTALINLKLLQNGEHLHYFRSTILDIMGFKREQIKGVQLTSESWRQGA